MASRHMLYKKGLTDRQIAEETGVTIPAICVWRHNLNLPSNKPQRQSLIDVSSKPMHERLLTRHFVGDLIKAAEYLGRTPTLKAIGKFASVWHMIGGISGGAEY